MCSTILKDQSLEFVWSLLDAGGKEHCETVWLLILGSFNKKRGKGDVLKQLDSLHTNIRVPYIYIYIILLLFKNKTCILDKHGSM